MNKRKDLFPSNIFMPNAFTPNGDGRNDLYPLNQYKVKGATYNIKLYNRWGEKIMELRVPILTGMEQSTASPHQKAYTYLWRIGLAATMRSARYKGILPYFDNSHITRKSALR